MAFFTLEQFHYTQVKGEAEPYYFLGWIISSKIIEGDTKQKLVSFGSTPSKLFPSAKPLNNNQNNENNENNDDNENKDENGKSIKMDNLNTNNNYNNNEKKSTKKSKNEKEDKKQWVKKSYGIELPELTNENQILTAEINFCLYKVFSEQQLEYLQQLFKSPSSFDDFSKKLSDKKLDNSKAFFDSIQNVSKIGEFIPLPAAANASFEVLKHIPQAFEFISNAKEWFVCPPFLWDQFQLRFNVKYNFNGDDSAIVQKKNLIFDMAKTEAIKGSNSNSLRFKWHKHNNYKTKVLRSQVRGVTAISFSLNINEN
ncbi:hypothetical protein DLAC_04939 [Tieghemostelium lacteum]|uniref:Uncharacterized protein n=1 Tax=Tieghemostelium lacteum TaxID=361077 RepID=A0A151ZHU5_TIELA|nr:hypothetical protein DLAC_04939 [Tieghemostelium lacteum]|eukprot:KYQ93568.1 hypothetical protein DLAC_04939 [Tieghemostelium lacteum]